MRIPIILAFFVFIVQSCRQPDTAPADPDLYYTCSMDPQVVEYKPGTCPICKMDLTPVRKSQAGANGDIRLSEQQVKLGNIRVDTLRPGKLGDRMVLTATLNFDQMLSTSVSARVAGRIEKLYYKNPGDFVPKGSPLYDVYSEDLNNAKQEHLLLFERKAVWQGAASVDFDQLLRASRNKLLLWGMTARQVDNLEQTRTATPFTTMLSTDGGFITELSLREGDYAMEGSTILKLSGLQTLWAEAQVYTSQLAELDRNATATVQLPDMDGLEIKGRIDFINPEISPDTRINLVRVSVPNPGNRLKPGMPAYVILQSPARNTISVPLDALIRDGRGATAWISTGPNTFRSVMVTTGLESGNRIEILSGLKNGDAVVTSGAYLLHSEYVFKKGSDPMAGHSH